MNKINKILSFTIIVLLASFSLFTGKGECGELPAWYTFVPEQSEPFYQTFPGTIENLKPLHDTTDIVIEELGELVDKAIIVVDTSNTFLMQKANQIKSTVFTATGKNLLIKDDDQSDPDPTKWITESDYENYNFILIGHHGNNAFVDKNIYRTLKQKVDSKSPGDPDEEYNNRFLINRVRIRGPQGVFTNTIVIGAQTEALLTNAVNHFTGVIPNTSTITLTDQQINCWENSAQTGSISINVLTPGIVNPYQSNGYNHSIQLATEYAIKYWLTGDPDYAVAFRKIIYNIGIICEGETSQIKYDPGTQQYYTDELNPYDLGDNGGNLDFHLGNAIGFWSKIESSVTNLNNPVMPNKTTEQERLYITQVLLYLTHAIYNQWGMGDNWEHYTIYNNELNGNHETSGTISVLIAGQYFGEDDYAYPQMESWFYDPWYRQPDPGNPGYLLHPEFDPLDPLTWRYSLNYGAGWQQAADIVFEPYLTATFPNDNAGGYSNASPADTRWYCWNAHPDDSDLQVKIENYFTAESEGIFNYGADRGFADLFCMLTPPTYRVPGFGDVHGFNTASSTSQAGLGLWAKEYNDGRYQWMQEQYGFTGIGGDDYWKTILNFGLYEPHPNPEPPNDLLGVKFAKAEGDPSVTIPYPLVPNTNFNGKILAYLNSYGGTLVNNKPTYNSEARIGEVHLEGYEGLNKAAFREGFDADDQFVIIDGLNGLGHGQQTALGMTEYHNDERIWLISHCFNTPYMGRKYHNVVTIEKETATGYDQASYKSSTVAALRDMASFEKTGFLDAALLDYGDWAGWGNSGWSTDLSRIHFWQRDGGKILVILDEVKARNLDPDDEFRISLNWKSLGDNGDPFDIDGNRYVINQSGKHCVVETLSDDVTIDYQQQLIPAHPEKENNWGAYPYANAFTTQSRIYAEVSDYALPNQDLAFASLIYTYSGDVDPDYEFSPVSSTHTIYKVGITATEDIYLGKATGAGYITFDPEFGIEADMFYVATEGAVPTYFSLVNGSYFSQGTQTYFDSTDGQAIPTPIPIKVEFDLLTQTGIMEADLEEGEELIATISLYANQYYDVTIDGETVIPSFNPTTSLLTFEVSFSFDDNRHEFYLGDGVPPSVYIYIDNVSVTEGNTGTVEAVFTVNLSQAGEEVITVEYASADGTATIADNDYLSASNTLVFDIGETEKPIPITVNGDTNIEDDETFLVNLSNASGATIADAQGQGIIINDDNPAPTFYLSIDNTSIIEGDEGTTDVTFVVTLSETSENEITVDYTTADGSAVAGEDYLATSGTLPIPAGNLTAEIPVTIYGDIVDESNEVFYMNLTNAGGATIEDGQGECLIIDDDDTVTVGHNVALNKPYDVSNQANGEYPDEGYIFGQGFQACTLTDGIYGSSTSFHNPPWAAWGGTSFWINIDLGEILPVNKVTISGLVGDLYGIKAVDSILVEVSTNGTSYSTATIIDEPILEQGVLELHDYVGQFELTDARYVRLTFSRTSGGFTFIDEIEVNSNQAPDIDPIDPITVIAGENAVVNASAADPDNDPIVFSIINQPSKVILEDHGNGTATITCQTNNNMAGETFKLILVASDGELEDMEEIIVTVLPRKPTLLPGPEGKNK